MLTYPPKNEPPLQTLNQIQSKHPHLKSTVKETKNKSETSQAVLSNQLQSEKINAEPKMIKNQFTAVFFISILTLQQRRKTCRGAHCRDLGASEEQEIATLPSSCITNCKHVAKSGREKWSNEDRAGAHWKPYSF